MVVCYNYSVLVLVNAYILLYLIYKFNFIIGICRENASTFCGFRHPLGVLDLMPRGQLVSRATQI
jgi:hypothetical protein